MNIDMYSTSMSVKKFLIVTVIIGLLFPFIGHAEIKITEVMYDPEGTDTKREWIEVYNNGSSPIDLNSYYLFENNVYHKLVAQGQSILNSGEYAIIVDSIAEVLLDYKDYIGKIFDSTFSLNNTGESISIADNSKQIIDTLTYNSSVGANNDGASLQLIDGTLQASRPTFGAANVLDLIVPDMDDDSSNNTSTNTTTNDSASSGTSSHIEQEPAVSYDPTPSFKIGAGRKRLVLINTPLEFEAQISKVDVRPRISWNFGDFETQKGRKVEHTYIQEGIYEVVAEGYSEGYTSISRTEVVVTVPQLEVIQVASSTLSFINKGKNEINIGGFCLKFKDQTKYMIPKNTIIRAGATIYKNLDFEQNIVELVYPNGEIYERFDTI
jgi:hypothetical protein